VRGSKSAFVSCRCIINLLWWLFLSLSVAGLCLCFPFLCVLSWSNRTVLHAVFVSMSAMLGLFVVKLSLLLCKNARISCVFSRIFFVRFSLDMSSRLSFFWAVCLLCISNAGPLSFILFVKFPCLIVICLLVCILLYLFCLLAMLLSYLYSDCRSDSRRRQSVPFIRCGIKFNNVTFIYPIGCMLSSACANWRSRLFRTTSVLFVWCVMYGRSADISVHQHAYVVSA